MATFNHDREDTLLTPCSICAKSLSLNELLAAYMNARSIIRWQRERLDKREAIIAEREAFIEEQTAHIEAIGDRISELERRIDAVLNLAPDEIPVPKITRWTRFPGYWRCLCGELNPAARTNCGNCADDLPLVQRGPS